MPHSVNHPTKEILISATVGLLDSRPGDRVLVDDVLAASGISRGSLYHHFGDFNDLLDEAQIRRFSRLVDATSDKMINLLGSVTNATELEIALHAITVETQRDAYASTRMLRARIIADSQGSEGLRKKLQVEIDRLTGTLQDLIQEAINRGWFQSTFPARTIAVFIQSYSLGKILNDLSASPVSEEEWNTLINSVISGLFIAR